MAVIKYPALKSLPDTPQMPTGYPGMVMLAFFPPLWFWGDEFETGK